MKDMIKMGLILLVFTAVSATVLGVTNSATEGIIKERLHAENIAAIAALLPEAEEFELVEREVHQDRNLIVEIYEGSTAGEVVGYTVKTNPNGYGGRVEVLTGINMEGSITGVKIGTQSETPGLGTKVTEPVFLNQFVGRGTAENFIATKGGETGDQYINAITGATVSTNAVTEGVNVARSVFVEVLKTR